MANSRAEAAKTIKKVLVEGSSFDSSFVPDKLKSSDPRDIGLYKELCFGTLRQYHFLEALISSYVKKPLNKKDWDIKALLLIGSYQLIFMRTPDHAALSNTVEACKSLKKIWAKGMVNAILRNLIKLLDDVDRNDIEAVKQCCSKVIKAEHLLNAQPEWLYEKIRADYSDKARDIFEHNNTPPPMCIRVAEENLVTTVKTTLSAEGINANESATSVQALVLDKAINALSLPGFNEGMTSVQDAGAQLAARLFDKQRIENEQEPLNILDACAAPGGKTLQLMQLFKNSDVELTALDISEQRLKQVRQNLERGGFAAKLIAADASKLDAWWDQKLFDAILLDAPCSGSGVINRHPDIKLLRRADDIQSFAAQQLQLLKTVWQTLRPGGELVYCTCSIFKEENQQIIEQFAKEQSDAKHQTLKVDWGIDTGHGHQLLPNIGENDGFFFAKLCKAEGATG